MITEEAKIVSVEDDAVWVLSQHKTSCGSCAVKSGCGQGLLAQFGVNPSMLRVAVNNNHGLHLNDWIVIGLNEEAMVKLSLFVYMLPLAFLLIFSATAQYFNANDGVTLLAGLIGFLTAGFFISFASKRQQNNPDYQAVFVSLAKKDELHEELKVINTIK